MTWTFQSLWWFKIFSHTNDCWLNSYQDHQDWYDIRDMMMNIIECGGWENQRERIEFENKHFKFDEINQIRKQADKFQNFSTFSISLHVFELKCWRFIKRRKKTHSSKFLKTKNLKLKALQGIQHPTNNVKEMIWEIT